MFASVVGIVAPNFKRPSLYNRSHVACGVDETVEMTRGSRLYAFCRAKKEINMSLSKNIRQKSTMCSNTEKDSKKDGAVKAVESMRFIV